MAVTSSGSASATLSRSDAATICSSGGPRQFSHDANGGGGDGGLRRLCGINREKAVRTGFVAGISLFKEPVCGEQGVPFRGLSQSRLWAGLFRGQFPPVSVQSWV